MNGLPGHVLGAHAQRLASDVLFSVSEALRIIHIRTLLSGTTAESTSDTAKASRLVLEASLANLRPMNTFLIVPYMIVLIPIAVRHFCKLCLEARH